MDYYNAPHNVKLVFLNTALDSLIDTGSRLADYRGMNNGPAIMSKVIPGALVTVRGPTGAQVTGRAVQVSPGLYGIRDAQGRTIAAVTAGTIIRVVPW